MSLTLCNELLWKGWGYVVSTKNRQQFTVIIPGGYIFYTLENRFTAQCQSNKRLKLFLVSDILLECQSMYIFYNLIFYVPNNGAQDYLMIRFSSLSYLEAVCNAIYFKLHVGTLHKVLSLPSNLMIKVYNWSALDYPSQCRPGQTLIYGIE